MHRRQRTLLELLTRSLAVAGLVYALVIVYAVPATLLADADGPTQSSRGTNPLSRLSDHPGWRASYADRFPGCVDVATWQTAAGVPGTVVVVRRDGRLARMSFDDAFRRATSASAADDVWTIGACD